MDTTYNEEERNMLSPFLGDESTLFLCDQMWSNEVKGGQTRFKSDPHFLKEWGFDTPLRR